ncbi:MAG TPA: glutathione transferase [Telluria sp.]|jgi:glutathione S-transferase
MAGLTLYVDTTFSSPYAMACFVTLVEKKLDFTLKTVDLDAGDHRLPAFRDLALTGRVPALVHGDVVLNESSAIIEYLEEAFPAPEYRSVLPAAIADRARTRQIQAWLRSDLMALREERNTGVIFFAPVDTPLSAAGQQAAQRLLRIASRLIDESLLFGSHWNIADTELALMLNRLVANGDPVPQHIAGWVAEQWARPSVQQWVKQPRG